MQLQNPISNYIFQYSYFYLQNFILKIWKSSPTQSLINSLMFLKGNSPSNNECQIFDSSQKISLDDHVEADDQYAFFWKYCADKAPSSDSGLLYLHAIFAF